MFKKAFTLTELLVVIAIIGILAGMVIVGVSQARQKGKIARIQSDVQQLKLQLESDVEPPAMNYATITGTDSITGFIPGIPGTATGAYQRLMQDAESNGADLTTWKIILAQRIYYISVRQPNNKYYCVDSVGSVGEYNNNPATGNKCP